MMSSTVRPQNYFSRIPTLTGTFSRRRTTTRRRLLADRCIKQLKALADSTRLRITAALLNESLSAQQLVCELLATQDEVTEHLHILHEAGIVAVEVTGDGRRYSVADAFQPQTNEIMFSILAASHERYALATLKKAR